MQRLFRLLAIALALVPACGTAESTDLDMMGSDDECECAANETGAQECALNMLQQRARSATTPTIPEMEMEADTPDGNQTVHAEGWFYAPPPPPKRHRYMATTTRYGRAPASSCLLDTAALVKGTGYYAVATSEAMQGGCCVCNRKGARGNANTARLGCGSCARGRFVPRYAQPYKVHLSPNAGIFKKEFHLVVGDICPHKGNEPWCQRHSGDRNKYGTYNHFDFSIPIPREFDNYYFEFSPMRCSREINRRMKKLSRCYKGWW